MKTFLSLLICILMQSSILLCQNLLSGPECVSFDSLHNRYLVSNWNDGNIVAIDSAGHQSYFKQRSGHALGNCITNNTFYVSTGNTILGLNLDNPNDTIMYLPVSGTSQMDGMTVDDNNFLYVIASIQCKIYKVDLLTQSYWVYVPSGISSRPQDVIYDRNYNRLLICSWYDNSPIQEINLSDSTVSNLVCTPTGNCDGLATDGKGNYYFSTWATNSVYSYDTTFTNPPVIFSSGHNGPSNICINKRDNIIAVPNFNSNSLSLIPVSPSSIKENDIGPVKFNLFQNYPDPFNNSTVIKFSVARGGFISLNVYNAIGEEVAVLVNEIKPPGIYKLVFTTENLTSGVYFYRLQSMDFVETKKMVLIK